MKAHTKNITHLFEHPYIVSIDDVFILPFLWRFEIRDSVLIFDVTFIKNLHTKIVFSLFRIYREETL